MILMVLVTVLLLVIAIVFVVGSPEKCLSDARSPLNFILLQEPRRSYTDEIVTHWVKKPWKTNGERIPCHLAKCDSSDGCANQYILYAHGNSADLLETVPLVKTLSHVLNMNVVSFDYSGYGLNPRDAYERSAEGMNQTLRAVWNDLLVRESIEPSQVYLYGYSLGSGPTLRLAASLTSENTPPKAVIVHGGFTSVLDVVGEQTHPRVAEFFHERWNNVESLSKLETPVLILHSKDDTVIPLSHAHRLRKCNPRVTSFHQLNGGHGFRVEEVAEAIAHWKRMAKI